MPENDDDKPAPPPSPRSFIDDLRAGKHTHITEALSKPSPPVAHHGQRRGKVMVVGLIGRAEASSL